MSFEEAYVLFKNYAKARHKNQGFITISKDFELKILSYFKNFNIYEITKLDVLDWYNDFLSKNYSNAYNEKIYYIFNKFLNYCRDYLDLKSNYLKEIGSFPRRIEEPHKDFYTIDEFNLFISNLDDYVINSYFRFMFFAGTRPGEAMGLRFSDLRGNFVYISHNLERRGERALTTPKNQSSFRLIELDDFTIKMIDDLRQFYIQKYGFVNIDYYIFGGLKPLSTTTIDRHKRKACEKANIKCITQHQFRHSHGSLLANNGIDYTYIQKRLGHAKLSTTTDIYLHMSNTQEKRAVALLSSLNK